MPNRRLEYETRAVLAGAYRGHAASLVSCLTHTLNKTTGRPLCASVKAANLADAGATDIDAEPTCKLCRSRDPRFD